MVMRRIYRQQSAALLIILQRTHAVIYSQNQTSELMIHFAAALTYLLSLPAGRSWSTSPRRERLSARARSAASTRNTKSRSTNPARPQTLLRASDDTTENSAVSVARQSQFSTRKLRQQRRLPCDWSAKFAKPKLTSASNAASLSSWVPRKLRVVTSIKFVVLKPMCIF